MPASTEGDSLGRQMADLMGKAVRSAFLAGPRFDFDRIKDWVDQALVIGRQSGADEISISGGVPSGFSLTLTFYNRPAAPPKFAPPPASPEGQQP